MSTLPHRVPAGMNDNAAAAPAGQARRWPVLRLVDFIWHVRGGIPLPRAASSEVIFDRLDPLFHERGTTVERAADTMVFRKDNPDAQDKLASFEVGYLRVLPGADGPVLRYDLTSHPLLWCFLAPLPFIAMALGIKDVRIASYSFAGIFAFLYLCGRVIEQRGAHRLLRNTLDGL